MPSDRRNDVEDPGADPITRLARGWNAGVLSPSGAWAVGPHEAETFMDARDILDGLRDQAQLGALGVLVHQRGTSLTEQVYWAVPGGWLLGEVRGARLKPA